MNTTQFHSVIFDFDSTLSTLEGVDYLAELHDCAEEVAALTAKAMNTYSITPDLYEKRLKLIHPRREDLATLAHAYKEHLVPGVEETVRILQDSGKTLYIVSGGIRKAIIPVGDYLGISPERIHAVDVFFTMEGEYSGFDRDSVLVRPDGKKKIIQYLAPEQPAVFIGDGANDLSARDPVYRFIGFGGAEYRPPIEEASEFYIKDKDFRATLPLILTQEEMDTAEFSDQFSSS